MHIKDKPPKMSKLKWPNASVSRIRDAIAMLQYVFLQYNIPTPSLSLPYMHLFRTQSIPINYTNSPQMNHNPNTVPIIIPANLKIATLFPDAAILPNLLADPFNDVLIEENVSDYFPLY